MMQVQRGIRYNFRVSRTPKPKPTFRYTTRRVKATKHAHKSLQVHALWLLDVSCTAFACHPKKKRKEMKVRDTSRYMRANQVGKSALLTGK